MNTFRTRLNGYYLTGDLLYRDAEGYYYHVDRASDAIDLGGGDWLYTALSEERILSRCADVRDCSVIAAREPDGSVRTQVLLVLAEDADPALDREADRPCRARRAGGPHPGAGGDDPRRRRGDGTDRQGPQVPDAPAIAGQNRRLTNVCTGLAPL